MSIKRYMGPVGTFAVLMCLFVLTGCIRSAPPASPALPTPDLKATVQAIVAASLPGSTQTPIANAEATIIAGVNAIREALATPTPTRTKTSAKRPLSSAAKTPTPTFTPTPTHVPTSTRPPVISRTPTSTSVPTATPTRTTVKIPTLAPKLPRGPINECGAPILTLLDTLGEIEIDDELSSGGSYVVNFDYSVGPMFILNEETIITEIGAFLRNPTSGKPFRIDIVRSSAGLPDSSGALHRIRGLSDDGNYGIYSYESVELDLTLPRGTYFALFSDPSDLGGRLLRSSYDHDVESSLIGTINHETGDTRSYTSRMAVRILGQPASTAVMPIRSFERTRTIVSDVAISNANGIMASAFSDGWVRTWKTSSGKRGAFFDHGEPVTTLAFSPDGELLVTGTSDGKLTLWDPALRRTQLNRLDADRSGLTSVAFSPDGKRVVTSSEDGSVRFWSVENSEKLKADDLREVQFEQAVKAVAFTTISEEPAVAIVIGKRIELWDIEKWEKLFVIEEPGQVNSLAFLSEGSQAIVGLESGAVSLWSLNDGSRLKSMQLEKPVTDISISPNDALLAIGSEDNTVHLWNIDSWSGICNIAGHERDITSVAFSPVDNDVLVSGSRDGATRLWKIDDQYVKEASAEFERPVLGPLPP